MRFAGAVLLAAAGPASASSGPARDEPHRLPGDRTGPRTVIIALPPVTWGDLRRARMPNLHQVMEQGAVGLMPVASQSDRDPYRMWATLGAGKAAVSAGPLARPELWGKWGLQFDLSPALRANARSHTGAAVGGIGDLLRSRGHPRAILKVGTPAVGGLWSPSVLALADRSGRVDGYRVVTPPLRGGVREDLADLLLHHSVVLLDLSDLPAGLSAGPDRRGDPAATAAALGEVDAMIGEAVAALERHRSLLLVLSPVSPRTTGPGTRFLGPVIMWETKGAKTAALLTSRSTRWRGLVAASDVAPTVLDWWGIRMPSGRLREAGTPGDPGQMSGRPAEAVATAAAPTALDELDRRLSSHYRWGFTAVKLYMTYCFLVVAAGLLLLLWRPRWLPRLRGAALAMPLAPVGMLVAQLLSAGSLHVWLLASGLATAAMAAVGSAFPRPALGAAVAMLVGAAAIMVDTLTGSWLVRTAPFAFPVMSGARFYGLGNEYMGVLLGLNTLGLAALLALNPARQWLFALLAAFTVLVIGAPFWGANWGGAVAAAVGLIAVWLFCGGARMWRRVAVAVALVALSAALPAVLDVALSPSPDQRTHIGVTASALLSSRPPAVWSIVQRKLAMSLDILTYTRWTIPLAAAAVVAFWVFLRQGSPARLALRGQRIVAGGILGTVVGGGMAMVVNDSGIVAGAGAMVCAISALLVLAGGEQGKTV